MPNLRPLHGRPKRNPENFSHPHCATVNRVLGHTDTLFLRQPNAPLDNTIVERALKKAILHRKNALFYKTENGAQVGDLFMSLIHTCELNGVPSLGYLVALRKHAREVAEKPAAWMPWNYRDALTRTAEV